MRITSLMLVAALGLTACGGGGSSSVAQAPAAPAPTGAGGGATPFGPPDPTVTAVAGVVGSQAEDQPEIDPASVAFSTPDDTEPVAL
ncbi:MAG: hypothetical protein V4754_09490 [Pseudomonadota bacterium]